MYSERDITLPEAKERIEHWLKLRDIDFHLETFWTKDTNYQIVRSFLTMDGKNIQVGNGKGIGKEPTVGAIFESVEHLIYFSQKHASRRMTLKEVRDQGKEFKKNVPMQFITHSNTRLNVDKFVSTQSNEEFYFPSFLSDTTFEDPEIAKNYPDLFQYSSNNGYAIGATRTEAILHALNELIERDSVSRALIKYGLNQKDRYIVASRLEIFGVEAIQIPYSNVDNDATFYSASTNELIEDIALDPCVVSIDLDFFYSSDNSGEDISFEITPQEAEHLRSDKDNKVALRFGKQCNIEETNGRHYLHLNLQSQFVHSLKKPEEVIASNTGRLRDFFYKNSKLNIKSVIICKSVSTGYVPETLLSLILKNVHAILKMPIFIQATSPKRGNEFD